MYFNFIATDNFDLNSLNSVERFVDTYPDFQTVVLADESELELLLELIGIKEFFIHELNKIVFTKYWDISRFTFPEPDDIQFDKFYEEWVHKSSRDNTMNEYGSLIFLQGLTPKWNKLKYKLVIKEEEY